MTPRKRIKVEDTWVKEDPSEEGDGDYGEIETVTEEENLGGASIKVEGVKREEDEDDAAIDEPEEMEGCRAYQ